MKKGIVLLFIIGFMFCLLGCGSNEKEAALEQFIHTHVERIKPIEKNLSLAYWNAAISGNQEDYRKYGELELKIRQIYSNTKDYTILKQYKTSGQIGNGLLSRQLDVLINTYLANQTDVGLLKQIVDLSTKVEQAFTTFRGTIKGKKVTSNEIKNILKTSTDQKLRKAAWLASKQVGSIVSEDVIQLAKLRNQAAQKLGFNSYHTMRLATGEQDVNNVSQILDELYGLTNEPFKNLKSELDQILSGMYNIPVEKLMPWHYHDPFFQETPLVYEDKDVKILAEDFFKGIDLPVESILEVSDLYEREGKNPHAFCTDIDREGDVRILCNLKNNESWMETLLHELGHGVYDKFLDPETPYLLRTPAHSFTTEAVAMFFGRLSRNASWMQSMLKLDDEQRDEIREISTKYAQLKQLIFARWAMVMFNFEKAFYENPDQDLNALWWDLVEKYQFIQKPKKRNTPDWASKIHIVSYPCYYHNYLLGELLASQFHQHLITRILKSNDSGENYINKPEVGKFFKKNVFESGNRYTWNEMIKKATGEGLTPKYFVDEFVE